MNIKERNPSRTGYARELERPFSHRIAADAYHYAAHRNCGIAPEGTYASAPPAKRERLYAEREKHLLEMLEKGGRRRNVVSYERLTDVLGDTSLELVSFCFAKNVDWRSQLT